MSELPSPTPTPQEREEALFATALERPASERAVFLDGACHGDAALRLRLEALLAAHEKRETLPATQTAAARLLGKGESALQLADEAVGQTLGRYKLLEKVGEGGCGVVYVAEQTEPVRRRVALKVIKLGMDTKQVVARFEAERQVLAMMDHSNIAKVLDAGTTDQGRPYFVMELVRGIKITDYCDQSNLPTKDRLELFTKVCHAVQHAHQKGIIHRDLKPSNILVTLHDGVPVPKVIDFGIAKATEGRLTDATVYTQLHQFIGTPAYMSPEQAEMSGLDIDTRSDIYSLGVLLYQLLTGKTPFESQELLAQGIEAMRRTIREKEPMRPSTRLATLLGQELTTTAKQRSCDAPKLIQLLKGDLDWIVMKCLEKDRTRRYETASGLAADLKRHLTNEPVVACPPSTGYKFRKFVQRHRGPVVAGALLLLALVGGIAGTSWGLLAAKRALRAEKQQRDLAERTANEREQARAAAEHEKDQKELARAAAEKALYFNRINLAAQYWQADNLAQSRRILDLSAPQSRGWEWRYLDRLHRADLGTLPGNGQYTTGLQLSRDGRRLAAFSPYGEEAGARIWDLTRSKSLAEISKPGNGRRFTCCALHPDGRMIAMGEESGLISIWDAEAGQMTREFAKLSRSVGSLSFSPEGQWLAAARADARNGEMLYPALEPPRNEDLVVWEVASGAEVFHPKGFGFVAEFSPDGTRLLTFKMNTARRTTPQIPETLVALFDTANWTEVSAGELGYAGWFAFSSTRHRLALGGYDRIKEAHFIRVIDTVTGNELRALSPASSGVYSDIALSPDASTLARLSLLGSLFEFFEGVRLQVC